MLVLMETAKYNLQTLLVLQQLACGISPSEDIELNYHLHEQKLRQNAAETTGKKITLKYSPKSSAFLD